MTKYLGIDYGAAHIGLATSEHKLATPLPSLPNDPAIVLRLSSIISKHDITHIICGIPEGKLVEQVVLFAQKLRATTHLPVMLHQETLSTQEATHKLKEAGASRAKRRDDHAYAACLILEDYLEFEAPMLY